MCLDLGPSSQMFYMMSLISLLNSSLRPSLGDGLHLRRPDPPAGAFFGTRRRLEPPSSSPKPGAQVFMSSFRSKTVLRLLTAHRVVGEEAPERLVFGTLDQARP